MNVPNMEINKMLPEKFSLCDFKINFETFNKKSKKL